MNAPAATPAAWRLLIELLEEVMHIHANPDDPDYNECDKISCMWCVEARKWVDYLRENSQAMTPHDENL